MLMFLDGFGLYRNMYRSLTGWYMIPAALNVKKRNRGVNVYVLTLGPHDAKFGDVVDTLYPNLAELDRGIDTIIKGNKGFLCAFSHGFANGLI